MVCLATYLSLSNEVIHLESSFGLFLFSTFSISTQVFDFPLLYRWLFDALELWLSLWSIQISNCSSNFFSYYYLFNYFFFSHFSIQLIIYHLYTFKFINLSHYFLVNYQYKNIQRLHNSCFSELLVWWTMHSILDALDNKYYFLNFE